MTVSYLQNQVQRLQREVSDLQNKLSVASKKESDANGKVAQVTQSMNRRNLSISQLQTKQKELSRYQGDVSKAQKEQSDLNKRIADKTKDFNRHQNNLSKEQERERKKLFDQEKKRQKELSDYNKKLDRELSLSRSQFSGLNHSQKYEATQPISQTESVEQQKKYDLFISHASENRHEFVRPLAEALQELGVEVWYDEFQLTVGDSLRRSIDKGLASSSFGVVVLSSAFFEKNWPQYELDGMVAREMNGVKVILPIWHKVSKDDVLNYSPSLADKVALNSSLKSIKEIAEDLAKVVLSDK